MTIDQLLQHMIVTAALNPGYPVALIAQGDELTVGLLNFEPTHDDWYQIPTLILTPQNLVIESFLAQEARYGDVAQR